LSYTTTAANWCWPERFTAHGPGVSESCPSFDANANAMAIEHIRLENEGWQPNTSNVSAIAMQTKP
jgi:hypothetical protein